MPTAPSDDDANRSSAPATSTANGNATNSHPSQQSSQAAMSDPRKQLVNNALNMYNKMLKDQNGDECDI